MYLKKSIILYLIFFIFKELVLGQKVAYHAMFSDTVTDCENFTNDFMEFQLTISPAGLDSSLCGTISLNEDITDEDMIQIEVELYREVDGIPQFIGSNVVDFCDNLDDEDASWFPFTKSMGVTECPLKKKTYETCDIIIDLSRFNDYLNSEYCGEYSVIMRLLKPSLEPPIPSGFGQPPDEEDMFDIKSCHEVSATLVEYNDE